MELFGRDTDPRTARVLVEGYRRMAPESKLAIVDDLTRAARQLAESGIRSRFPDASAEEVRLRLGALLYGRDIMLRAFGWDPELQGW